MSYSAQFKDHLAHPRNAGELPDANAVADEKNPVCGDRLRLSLIIKDDRIETARYLAYGCPPTLVCGSVLTELIIGKTTEEAKQLTRADLLECDRRIALEKTSRRLTRDRNTATPHLATKAVTRL